MNIIGQEKLTTELEKIFSIFKASEGTIKPHFILTGESGSGKTFTEETKLKMRESRKGYKHTQESLDKMSLSQKGRTREDMIGNNNPSKNIEIREKLKGSNNHNSKKVINAITNELFSCARKAWEKYHKEQYCYNYFMEMVRNKKPNKTNFKYL